MNHITEELIDRLRAMYVANGTNYVQAAADKLEAQAERIKELELDLDVQAGSIEAVQAVNTRQAERIEALEGQLDDATAAARSDQMIAETAQAAAARLLTERDTLRAQLAEIEEAEPVLVVEKEPDYWSGGHFHEGSKSHIGSTKVWRLPISTKLYTRPMPVQSAEHCLWARNGHEPCQHVKPAQDVTELVEALERIETHRLTNMYWASSIARKALSKYKGAK